MPTTAKRGVGNGSPCRRPLNGQGRNEVPGLGRQAAIGGIGVDVFDRGVKSRGVVNKDFPAAFCPWGALEVQGAGCGAFELVDDILDSVIRSHDEYVHMVVHNRTDGYVQSQSPDDFSESVGDDRTQTVIDEERLAFQPWGGTCPEL